METKKPAVDKASENEPVDYSAEDEYMDTGVLYEKPDQAQAQHKDDDA